MITYQDFLTWESSAVCVDFKPAYVDMADGNVIAGLLLSQIVFWHLPTSQAQFVSHDGLLWLVKGHHDWYQECRLSRQNVRTALRDLGQLDLIRSCCIKNKSLVYLNLLSFFRRWQKVQNLDSARSVDLTNLDSARSVDLTSKSVDLTSWSVESTSTKERKKEENRYVNVSDDDGCFLENEARLIFDVLSEINSTLSKPIGGLPKLATQLQAKGHTSQAVGEVWQDCQAANKPVGAFLYWSKHGYLPFKPKPKPANEPNQPNPVFQALNTLNSQLPPDAKPFVGLPAMADKLNKRQESVCSMRHAWRACKSANNPVGAFVKWVNDGTLPIITPTTESPVQTDHLGRVWGGAGIGWLNQK